MEERFKSAQHCLKGRQGVNLETECKMPDEEKWRGWGVLPLLLTGHTGHTALQNTFKTLDYIEHWCEQLRWIELTRVTGSFLFNSC